MRKGLVIVISLVLVTALLIGCSGPTTQAPAPTTAAPAPTTAAPKPTTAAPAPATAAPGPTTAAPKPTGTAAPAPTGAPSTISPAKAVELKYANPQNVMHLQYWVKSVLPYSERVAERTTNKITVKPYHDASLLAEREVLDGVRKGITDTALIQSSYFPSILKAHKIDVNDLFGDVLDAYRSALLARILWTEFPVFQEEYIKNNSIDLFGIASGSSYILVNKPIKTLADMQGLRIRVTGTYTPKILAAAGMIPVAMQLSDVYDAIQKGVLAGFNSVTPSIRDGQFDKVAKYIFRVGNTRIANAGLGIIMNLDVWKSLPLDVKQIMVGEGQKMEKEFADFMERDAQEALNTLTGTLGVTLVNFSKAERDDWASKVPDLYADWIKEMNDYGQPGQKMMDRIFELSKMSTSDMEKVWAEAWKKHSAFLLGL
ncbi:MAG: TRAP transporter substrate-binding protein DctP [Chloroflexi bacterium]|nr:TRAP transporter substrate-binding protein DctP [Chloroflexota bacterium]